MHKVTVENIFSSLKCFSHLSYNYQVAAWLLMTDDWWRGGSAGANSLVSLSGSEEGATHFWGRQSYEDSLKGGDLQDTWRICVTNWKRVGSEDCLNIITNDNNSSTSDNDAWKGSLHFKL